MPRFFSIPAVAALAPLSPPDKRQQRRLQLFHEPVFQRLQRLAYGCAYQLMPKRLAQLPALGHAVMSSLLRGGIAQPGDADVRIKPAGFAGVARDLNPQSLLAAHHAGFFPQAHIGPQKWWTREQRYVQILAERRLPKTLRYEMRKAPLIITFDQAFDAVIKACAESRPGRPKLTWITPKIMHLYAQLHDAGHAHSFEVWNEAGDLVGGGYGVAVGRIFVTESLFSRVSSASKMGLQSLNYHLDQWGFVLNDVKDFAPHFANVGSRHVTRADYNAMLREFGDSDLPAGTSSNVVPWRATASLIDIVNATPNATTTATAEPAPAKAKAANPAIPPVASLAGPKPARKPKIAAAPRATHH
jgi:leucyl/phenylalanyl-tRNA---protein transferase